MQIPNRISLRASKMAAVAIAVLLFTSLALLAGCAQSKQPASEEPPVTPSSYMTAVAKSSSQLSERLAEFATAAAESDIPAIQVKADAAYEVLDQIDSLEAPEELKAVKGKYDEATKSLKDALKDYTAMFLEIENAPEGQPYDFSNYAQQLEAVQKAYDQGLNLLEEADKMATEA